MRLHGRIIVGPNTVREIAVDKPDENASFRDVLEECLIKLCKELDIQVPLWLKKNTTEFAAFRRTFFSKEQFLEDVWFDRFEIRIEQ